MTAVQREGLLLDIMPLWDENTKTEWGRFI